MKYTALVVVLAVCLLTSCTPVSLTDAHITGTPKPPSFNTGERVAALDVVAPANLQEFAPFFSNALLAALEEAEPPIRAISFRESGNVLNDQGLAEDYADLVVGFLRSGILERERLRRVGSALGSRYVLLPGVAAFDQSVIDRFDVVGLKVVRNRVTTLRLWLQLWDTKTAHNLWEATGEVTVVSQLLRVKQTVPLETIAESLWLRIIRESLLEQQTRPPIFLRNQSQ